jgi:signal transduction histidine kinase
LSSPMGDFKRSFPNETNASYCAFLCDNNGHIIGDVGEQLLGSNRSITSRSLVDLIEAESLMAFLEAVGTRGATLGWETRIQHGKSASTLLLHGSRTPFGILVFATVTPRLATLQDDRSVPSATVQGSRTRRNEEHIARLLSNALHDLNNPISSIISACEYLVVYSPENLNPEQLQMITEIELSARTLLQLSGRIADLSHR